MESDLKRGIEIRKSIRLPTKRLAPAPPLRSSGGGSGGGGDDNTSKPEPPPTSLRQLLGSSSGSSKTDNDNSTTTANRVPHRSAEEAAAATTTSALAVAPANGDYDKRQLAVRTDGGGIAATTTKLVVDDGVHELNLKNLRVKTTTTTADNDGGGAKAQDNNKMSSGGGAGGHAVLSARKMMAPLSPSLVRRITSLNQGQVPVKKVTAATPVISTAMTTSATCATATGPIKLSDLDGLVKRRDYVNQEATAAAAASAGVAPLRIMPTAKKSSAAAAAAAIPETSLPPPLTSIDVLNQIQQQISDMEVKQREHHYMDSGAVDASAEDMATYKDRIKMSKRYGEKEELSMKHGTSDVASNQLLGYLGDYRDNVRPSTETDDEEDLDRKSDEHQFQRGSSVRKSTGGAVMATKTSGMTSGITGNGKGKPVSRTSSDTKNLETKIKMMREAANHHHHGPSMDTKASVARRVAAKPAPANNKLPFSFTKPRILDMNEKHLVHQVTPPNSVGVANSGGVISNSAATAAAHNHPNQYHQRPDEYPARASPVQPPRVQSVQSHAKKMEQVMSGCVCVCVCVDMAHTKWEWVGQEWWLWLWSQLQHSMRQVPCLCSVVLLLLFLLC